MYLLELIMIWFIGIPGSTIYNYSGLINLVSMLSDLIGLH